MRFTTEGTELSTAENTEDAETSAVSRRLTPRRPFRLFFCLSDYGYHQSPAQFGAFADYGEDALALERLIEGCPDLDVVLDPALPIRAAQIFWAVRHEMARTVDDALARRTRALSLNVKAALHMAPAVARLMAAELGRDEAWQKQQVAEFSAIAEGYLPV